MNLTIISSAWTTSGSKGSCSIANSPKAEEIKVDRDGYFAVSHVQVSLSAIPGRSTRCQCGDHLPQRGVVHAAENSAQCSGQVALLSPAASHPGR